MTEILRNPGAGIAARWSSPLTGTRCESIAAAYFFYIALLATASRGTTPRLAALWVTPLVVLALCAAQRRHAGRWSSIIRDWLLLALILVGYWEAGLVNAAAGRWDERLISFDRVVFGHGLQQVVEAMGWVVPSLLEAVYLCLYAIPPICMAMLYMNRSRRRANHFLVTMFLGTFSAYALLPYFPTISPRLSFPNEFMPHYSGALRSINVWLLNHWDNSTSVFPSGHVAVAFSSAFGLLRAVPERRRLWQGAFLAATLVLTATIYCRYHYAADGLLSVGIATLAWAASGAVLREAEFNGDLDRQ